MLLLYFGGIVVRLCLFIPNVFIISQLFMSCQSPLPTHPGIQPGFEALNPAAVVAVPIFILPNPAQEGAVVDPSLIYTEKLPELIEKRVLKAFDNQPNINGFSYDAVRKALEKKDNNSSLFLWEQMNQTMGEVATRFSSRDVSKRLLITSECLARRDFLHFYSNCLAPYQPWINELNRLSFKIMNADSALISVVYNLENSVIHNKYSISLGLAVMLVDTNNGKLIWGNDDSISLSQEKDFSQFPRYETLLDKIFTENFWKGFPGRRTVEVFPKKLIEAQ